MVLQFDKEVVRAEYLLQPGGVGRGQFEVAPQQRLVDQAAQATRGGDDPFVIALQQFPVGPGLVPVPREVRLRGQFQEVLVAAIALGQQRQVVVELVALLHLATGVVHAAPAQGPLQAALGRHVGLDPDYWLHAGLVGGLIKIQDAVHIAVVGYGNGGLAVGRGPLDDFLDPGRPVQHGKLSVQVQVGERRAHVPGHLLLTAPDSTRAPGPRTGPTGPCEDPVDNYSVVVRL